MNTDFSTIGIFAKHDDRNVAQTLEKLTRDLHARGKQVLIDDAYDASALGARPCPRQQLGSASDLVVVIGGDGTFLSAGRAVAEHNVPLLGINLGRLGFMVDVLPEEMQTTFNQVFAGNYIAEKRLMLNVRIQTAGDSQPQPPIPAINECVVRNQTFARVLDFDTYMNGLFISHHRADGIAIATPTGSTAYALSGGGPVLHPDLSALAMVPICPHTLSDRPLIVDAAHELEIRISHSLRGQAQYSSDGQISRELTAGDRLLITRASHDLHLIHPPGYDYFAILRNKLHWGRGQEPA